MTERTRRPTLVPRWLVAAAAVVIVIALFFIPVLLAMRPTMVTVPAVDGLDAPVARSRLAEMGLLMTYGDTRFSSDVSAGGVLEQDPPAGAEVVPGTIVMVVLSAGADTITMPDLLGAPVETARVQLEARGLVVEIEAVPSDAEPGSVIAQIPAPDTEIESGTVVRLTIAGELGADVLLRSDLSGTLVLIDPAPPEEGQVDIAMEMTRHLRSLLEASGAEVLITRSIVETVAPPAMRAAWARESSPTVVVGLGTGPRPGGGRSVSTLPSTPERAAFYLSSVDLARAVVSELSNAQEDASIVLPTEDPVLDAARAPGMRLLLGSPADPANVEDFADPAWVDRVSRAIYRALAAAILH